MSGRILVIDAAPTTRIVLKVKLAAARYDAATASDLPEARRLSRETAPRLILVAVPPSRAEAAALVARIAGDPVLGGAGILAVGDPAPGGGPAVPAGALLAAGAVEALTRPLDDGFLMARIRSLLRRSDAAEELELRDGTSRALGLAEAAAPEIERPGRVAILSDHPEAAARLRRHLAPHLPDRLAVGAPEAAIGAPSAGPAEEADVYLLDLTGAEDRSALLAQVPDLRARSRGGHAALVVAVRGDDPAAAALALDLGADDVVRGTADPAETALRLRALVKSKQSRDRLRESVRDGLRRSVTDELTGVWNRHYAMPHLARTAERAVATGRAFAVLLVDLDRFKAVNDTYGHAAGDAVLAETAGRLRTNLRLSDMVARVGGEEFLVVMPDTTLQDARRAAERLCAIAATNPIELPGGGAVTVTMSIGLTMGGRGEQPRPPGESLDGPREAARLMAAADRALYRAKNGGRDRVTVAMEDAA